MDNIVLIRLDLISNYRKIRAYAKHLNLKSHHLRDKNPILMKVLANKYMAKKLYISQGCSPTVAKIKANNLFSY